MRTIKLFFTSSVQNGLSIGWRVGLLLSVVYAVVGLIVLESLGMGTGLFEWAWDVLSGSSLTDWPSLAELFSFLGFVGTVTFGILISIIASAIIPSVLLGSLTGIWLGKFIEISQKRFPKHIFVVLCILFCLVVVILIHIFFKIPVVLSFRNLSNDIFIGSYKTYPFSIGIPSLIYIIAGGWVGLQLYTQATTKKDGQG